MYLCLFSLSSLCYLVFSPVSDRRRLCHSCLCHGYDAPALYSFLVIVSCPGPSLSLVDFLRWVSEICSVSACDDPTLLLEDLAWVSPSALSLVCLLVHGQLSAVLVQSSSTFQSPSLLCSPVWLVLKASPPSHHSCSNRAVKKNLHMLFVEHFFLIMNWSLK